MTHLEYIIAAYTITLGALATYAVIVWRQLRHVERRLASLTGEGEGDVQR
jgi:hypothetical protein